MKKCYLDLPFIKYPFLSEKKKRNLAISSLFVRLICMHSAPQSLNLKNQHFRLLMNCECMNFLHMSILEKTADVGGVRGGKREQCVMGCNGSTLLSDFSKVHRIYLFTSLTACLSQLDLSCAGGGKWHQVAGDL